MRHPLQEQVCWLPSLRRARCQRSAIHFYGCAWPGYTTTGQQVIGVETEQGPMMAEVVVLATGAWAARWHTPIRVRSPSL